MLRRKGLSLGMVALALVAAPLNTHAAESKEESGPETSIAVSLNQDIFFGFYGTAQVGVGLSDTLDLTFYSILWTIPAFGAGGGGQNLWTEWGAGINFKLLNGNLGINPQFGITNGNLLAGTSRGRAIEGIVPNLTVNYGDGFFEGQIYAGFYVGIREQSDNTRNDFIHYWINAGVAPTSWLSVGAHWEHLVQNFGSATGEVEDVYQWLGPYIQASSGVGFIRFSAGVDLTPDDPQDFYKVNVGVTL